MAEAVATGAATMAVGCPFCMIMLTDAAKELPEAPQVRMWPRFWSTGWSTVAGWP